MDLVLMAGASARERLLDEGLRAESFSTLIGASGGPKWLVLSQMDRVLARRVVVPRSSPIHLVGSSIGAFRHLCLAMPDAEAAIRHLLELYLSQSYSKKPNGEEVSAEFQRLLGRVLRDDRAVRALENPSVNMSIVTARCRLPWGLRREKVLDYASVGLGALSNGVSRRALGRCYQRAVFSNAPLRIRWRGFSTQHIPLTAANLSDAVAASGSVPLVMQGVLSPDGAPPGMYWDGGLIDYHFGPDLSVGDGLVLYPHFFKHWVPGWFDKPFRKRRLRPWASDNVVSVAPSDAFVRRLPGGRVPDRKDFYRYRPDERVRNWRQVIQASKALARDLETLFEDREAVRAALLASPS